LTVDSEAEKSELEPQGGVSEFELARHQSELSAEGGDSGKLTYEEGFTWKVVAGAIFVAFIMLPGSIYMGLVTGASLGPAAQWVTIVLFSEVARRSFLPLKRQEIYMIYYMAASLTLGGFTALPGISGGPIGNLIALQYLLQSPQMANVTPHLPGWIAPHLGSRAYTSRTFLDSAWAVPLLIMMIGMVLDRMKWIGLGFFLFKLTSDVERLPFPMAPVAASGATALVEANTKDESWRWGVFSTGSIVGLIFGVVYLAIPILSNGQLIFLQIPFFDLTPNTEHFLPTALVGYNPDLGALITGFVLPWHIVAGAFCGSVLFQIIGNPILYRHGFFPDFVPSSNAIQAQIALNFDFWMSFGIGLQFSVAVLGIVSAVRAFWASGKSKAASRGVISTTDAGRGLFSRNKDRGDFPIVAALGAWFTATLGYVLLCHQLVPLFPFEIIAFYGLVWTPLNSYISARMVGLTGQPVAFPFLNQAVVLKSGYTSSDIWFAPLPLNDYGWSAQRFRELELTGTKFTSVVKVEIFMLFVLPVASFLYWGFLWHTSSIPSAQFPYAQKMWPISAASVAIFSQINNRGGASWILHAIKYPVIGSGLGVGLVFYLITLLFKWPLLFFYGFMGGATQFPHNVAPTFVGALLSRYYFAKRFGAERWSLYAPVLLAGFFCGIGLMGMAAIAVALIAKTVNYLPF
jgi:hypothetical protein